MALEGKRLRWYFNIGGETAEVLMSEDVESNGNFNSVVLERYDVHDVHDCAYTSAHYDQTWNRHITFLSPLSFTKPVFLCIF